MEAEKRKRDVDPCPKCGHSDLVVPIVYGYPTNEAMEAAERGEVILGGCEVGDIDPRCLCHRCQIYFRFQRPELARGEVESESADEG